MVIETKSIFVIFMKSRAFIFWYVFDVCLMMVVIVPFERRQKGRGLKQSKLTEKTNDGYKFGRYLKNSFLLLL